MADDHREEQEKRKREDEEEEEKETKKKMETRVAMANEGPFVVKSKGIADASVFIPTPGSPFFVSDHGFDISETTTTPIADETNNAPATGIE